MSANHFVIHTDGGARGNPGPAAYAFVLSRPGGADVEEKGYLGETTNNIAEYTALVKALEKARELGGSKVTIKSDSELMVKQMKGQYKVRNEGLLPLFDDARKLARSFDEVVFQHVRREHNKHADRLCNEALDEALGRGGARAAGPASKRARPAADVAPPASREDAWSTARGEGMAVLDAAREAWRGDTRFPTSVQVWNELLNVLDRHGLLVGH